MTSYEIRLKVNVEKANLNNLQNKKTEWENKYETLVEFSRICEKKADSFNESILKRKGRLCGIQDLLGNMKSANNYHAHMNEALTGNDYATTTSNIESLFYVINQEKSKILYEINNLDQAIRASSYRISNLEYEYEEAIRLEELEVMGNE